MATSDELRERQEVEDVVVRVFIATDRRDWASVEECLADPLVLDMTSMAGGEPLQMKPSEISAAWREGSRLSTRYVTRSARYLSGKRRLRR